MQNGGQVVSPSMRYTEPASCQNAKYVVIVAFLLNAVSSKFSAERVCDVCFN